MFVAALRKLAEHCEFGDVLNDILRDRLVCGLRNEAAQKRLLTESTLTLEKAINISVTMEMASKEAQQLNATGRVHQLVSDKTYVQGPCFRCGKSGHLSTTCWAKELDCHKCGKKGHIERVCRSNTSTGKSSKMENKRDNVKYKQKRHVRTVQHKNESSDSSSEEVHTEVNTVRIMSMDGSSDGYWAEPQLEGHSVKMQIDTGSKASLLSHKLYKKYMRHLPLRPSDTVFKAYTGHRVHMEGMTDVTVIYNGQTKKLPVYVTKGNHPAIMGRAWLREIRLDWQVIRKLSCSLTPLQQILEKNVVFRDELGSMKDITVKLHVKADSKPVFMKARPVPYAIRTKVEADLDALVKNGVLEPVRISKWATPIVPVQKRRGNSDLWGL